jgi:hypothetical protein
MIYFFERYDESQIYLSTFVASFGYCNKLTAFDMIYAVEALLENNVIYHLSLN